MTATGRSAASNNRNCWDHLRPSKSDIHIADAADAVKKNVTLVHSHSYRCHRQLTAAGRHEGAVADMAARVMTR
jgi:hypothetical protein